MRRWPAHPSQVSSGGARRPRPLYEFPGQGVSQCVDALIRTKLACDNRLDASLGSCARLLQFPVSSSFPSFFRFEVGRYHSWWPPAICPGSDSVEVSAQNFQDDTDRIRSAAEAEVPATTLTIRMSCAVPSMMASRPQLPCVFLPGGVWHSSALAWPSKKAPLRA